MTTPLPDLGMTPTTTTPATMSSAATRPVAGASATTSGGGAFANLLNLQSRGRALEAKLQQAASGADAQDPAATAASMGATGAARQLKELRELVGPQPGGNARRALAAVIARLEGGADASTTMRPSDRARIKLAIAADEHRVDLAGAKHVRTTILSIDNAIEQIQKQTSDPTLVDDPARLAQFQQQHRHAMDMLDRVETALAAGRVDPGAVRKAADPMAG